MSDEIIKQLLVRNQQLLMLAQSESWDQFVEGVESYIRDLKQLRPQEISQRINPDNLKQLIAQDAVLRQHMQDRLNSLSGDMTAMRKSRQSAQAYNAV